MLGSLVMLLLLGLLIAVLFGSVYAFSVGLRAFHLANAAFGDARQSLYWLGLNLCEPLVNTILITLLFISMSWRPLVPFWSSVGAQGRLLVLIAPMGVLLLPVLGLFPSDPFYRGRNAVILLLGMSRWILASAALWMMLTPFALVFASIGTGVLWRSAVWGSRQLGGSPRLTPTTTYTPEK